ncbi:MAG: ATPase, partial [Clostridiaceae bacterium]|nr:ATPase [Clostridiaceae bacterium]
MSTLSKCKELLKQYSTARIPFIAINTIERGRTLELLRDVSNSLSLAFYVHTLSKGMYELNTGKVVNEDKTVYGAIDFMSEQMKRRQYLTLVLTETPDLSSDNSDSRQMLDLVTLAEESGGVVIVLTNNPIWNQLQRLGMVIKLDPPDEDEMYEIIKEYIDDYRNEISIEWDNSDIREAAAALAGVTRIEAQNVIAALIANKKITKEDLAEVRSSKDRLFS